MIALKSFSLSLSLSRSHIAASSLVIGDTDDNSVKNNNSVIAAAAAAEATAAATDNNNTTAMAHVYYSISLQDYVVTKADDLNANEQHSKHVCVYTLDVIT